MKNINKIMLVCSVFLITFFSCKDDSIQVIPVWETGVNTYATVKSGGSGFFPNGNAAVPVDLNFRWISIDALNTVTKIEFFLLFNEGYIDPDGNPAVARHGGTDGRLFKTVEGAAVPANRTDVGVTVTWSDVYNLYKDNTFNYCGTSVPVFNNTLKPTRTTGIPFVAGDSFVLKWIVYTEDGRKFDSWSPSVCTEFPGSNCQYAWSVTCASNLSGTYSYSTTNVVTGDFGAVPNTYTGTGTLVEPSEGTYDLLDFSFGVFGGPPYAYPPAKGSLKLRDACGFLSFAGADQYGDTYTLTFVSVTATVLTFDWVNTYGDGGRTSLTRTDAKTWPVNLTTTPSGSCN